MLGFKSQFKDIDFAREYHSFINPSSSSKKVFPNYVFGFFVLFLACIAYFDFKNFSYNFLIFTNIVFLINFLFKFFLFGCFVLSKPKEREGLRVLNLPVYTILLPIYKEERHVLQALVNSIKNLNYPKEKLDVKFLLEEGDLETFSNLSSILHDFEVLIVPNIAPKTKPKACNFGLYYAKGEFVVIYDAEDRPEPNQLLKALGKFDSSCKKVICVQATLNFYNTKSAWLARCFAVEYLIWFNAFLPILPKLGLFIPLGGTSNHFKTKELIEIGGWDAYNVTEDAELGIRIKKKGYKTEVISSVTLEEAPEILPNWLLQRTRWQKGFLQTFLVHVFDFRGNFKIGVFNFLNLFFMIGLSFFSFFLVPVTAVLIYFVQIDEVLGTVLAFNMVSNLIYLMFYFYVVRRENFVGYEKIVLMMPFYFLFHIFSSYLAFFEIFIKPFYWHKTRHGA